MGGNLEGKDRERKGNPGRLSIGHASLTTWLKGQPLNLECGDAAHSSSRDVNLEAPTTPTPKMTPSVLVDALTISPILNKRPLVCGPCCTAHHVYNYRVSRAAAAAEKRSKMAALCSKPPSPSDTEATISWGQSLLQLEVKIPTGVFGHGYARSAKELWQLTHMNGPLTSFVPGKAIREHRWTFDGVDPNGRTPGTLNFEHLKLYARAASSDAAAVAHASESGDPYTEIDTGIDGNNELNRPVWGCPLMLREVELSLRSSDYTVGWLTRGATDGEPEVDLVIC